MKKRTKRGLVVGGAALAIVGGGGAALAAGGDLFGANEKQAFLDDAAARLKVDSSDLKAALSGAFDDRVDAAVKAGKLTKEQGDALKARVKQNGGLPLFGGPGLGRGHGMHGMGRGGPHGGPRASMTTAATYLGLTEAELRTQLQSGQTLAQVAKAQGKSVDGLKQAMTDAAKKDLAADVKAGRLTQAQADAMLKELSARLDDMIQNGRPKGPHFEGGRHFQFKGGAGSGFGPPGAPPSLPPAA